MKRKVKVVAFILMFVLLGQTLALASDENSVTMQPRGVYLYTGSCTLSPQTGAVKVWGDTSSFSKVNELTVKLTVFKEISPSVWSAIWSDTYTAYNTDYAYFKQQFISVSPGNYKLEGTHTAKHNGVTETNYSKTGYLTIY